MKHLFFQIMFSLGRATAECLLRSCSEDLFSSLDKSKLPGGFFFHQIIFFPSYSFLLDRWLGIRAWIGCCSISHKRSSPGLPATVRSRIIPCFFNHEGAHCHIVSAIADEVFVLPSRFPCALIEMDSFDLFHVQWGIAALISS